MTDEDSRHLDRACEVVYIGIALAINISILVTEGLAAVIPTASLHVIIYAVNKLVLGCLYARRERRREASYESEA